MRLRRRILPFKLKHLFKVNIKFTRDPKSQLQRGGIFSRFNRDNGLPRRANSISQAHLRVPGCFAVVLNIVQDTAFLDRFFHIISGNISMLRRAQQLSPKPTPQVDETVMTQAKSDQYVSGHDNSKKCPRPKR